jgi:hypothetical protein
MAAPIITAEQLRLRYFYSPETGEFKAKPIKYARLFQPVFGQLSPAGYLVCGIGGRQYRLHRLAWLYVYGEFPKLELDHINGVRTDNRICNLRECTRSENLQNQRGVSGAWQLKKSGKWVAAIGLNKKTKRLGSFHTFDEAHQAYLKAKQELHPFAPQI